MTRKQEITYHIIFWVLFITMGELSPVFMGRKPVYQINHLIDSLPFILLQMLIFYLNYALICPKTIPQKKWVLLIAGQLCLLLLFPGIRYLVEEVIFFYFTGNHNYADDSRQFLYYVYDNSYFVLKITLYSLVFYLLKYAWNTAYRLNTLNLEKKQAELQVLKSQMSPHFLFNTLNSFYADLFDTQPEVADDILKLSEMLRYITYENEEDTVLISREIEFIKNYIALFQRRFDHRAAIHFIHPTEIGNGKVPSLLLIHFVENAFKHGIIDAPETPVMIDLQISGNRLIFRTENSYRESDHYDATGIGQKNIEQRLNILFNGNYQLDIKNTGATYEATLTIPIL